MTENVKTHGCQNWKTVSKVLSEEFDLVRSAKQCRDRWTNFLRIEKYSNFFTDQEKISIFTNFRKLGSKWSVLSAIIQSKSENQIKNFLNSTIRRNLRKFNKGKADEEQIKFCSLDLLEIVELQNILEANKSKSLKWFEEQTISNEARKEIEIIQSKSIEQKIETSPLIKELDCILDKLLRGF